MYRATDPRGPFLRLTNEALTGTSYADDGLAPRNRFLYRIGTLSDGDEVVSNTASIETRWLSWGSNRVEICPTLRKSGYRPDIPIDFIKIVPAILLDRSKKSVSIPLFPATNP